MYVIPYVMTEEDVLELTENMLQDLAACSTDVVKIKVRNYLANPEAKEDVKNKVRNAYFSVFDLDDYLSDPILAEKVDRVKNLNYKDINPGLTDAELTEYANIITKILIDPRSTAYIPPIKGVLVKSLITQIEDYAKTQENYKLKKFAKTLKSKSTLFRDSRFKEYTKTPMQRIIINQRKFEIILRGIQFLQSERAKGYIPSHWRIL